MPTAKMIISSRSSNQWAVSIFYIQSIVCTKRARETKREKKDIVSCLQDKQNNNHNSNNVASLVRETAVLLLLKFNGFLTSE